MSEATALLKEIRDLLREIRDAQRAGGAARSTASTEQQPRGGGEVASDRDLDGDHGNPAVRKDPSRWNVASDGSYVGCTFSECPPEYLDLLANLFDWQADKDEQAGKVAGNGKPTARYKRMDAARARGWAQRIRNGWRPVGAPAGAAPDNAGVSAPAGDPFIPF